MISNFAKFSALAAALALAAPAAAQDLSDTQSSFEDPEAKQLWSAKVERTERGHLIGNPHADVQLIEFVSYTCGHCASFTAEGEPALDMTVLAKGEMGLEVRPVIRNPIDLAVSLLANCGDPSGFKARHRDLMLSQKVWLNQAINAPQSQQAIWMRGDKNARINAASALGLDDKMIARGLTRSEVNVCLMDDAAASALIENGKADNAEFKVPGTPSFALDGKLLEGVHQWASLYPVLSERFAANKKDDSVFSNGN